MASFTAFRALVRKDLVLYFSNRRALVMSILAPIVIAAFFGAIFGSGMDKPTRIPIAFADRDASALSKALAAAVKADAAFDVKEGDEAAVVALARAGKVRAAIVLPPGSASRCSVRSAPAATGPSSPSTTTRRRRRR
jgi:ABC-2 type transport system permease protein